VLFALATLFLVASRARADDNPFAQGAWNVSLSGAYTTPIRFSRARTYSVTASWGRYLFDNLSLNGELQGYYAEQPDDTDVLIGGIGVLARTHLWRHDAWSIFFDGGGGVTFADNPFPTYPYEGTHFNFIGKLGFGATYQLHEHEFLTGGVRYFHLSNGQIHGKDQNPTYDSIQLWAGLMWTW
jgi:hypothetical protein